jgi:PAS domain S-box-containing protein
MTTAHPETDRPAGHESRGEELYRAIFDTIGDAILVADEKDRRLLLGNRAACAMLGYTEQELLSLGIQDIHPPGALEHVLYLFERQLRGEVPVAEAVPVQRRDGTLRYVDVRSAPIRLKGHACLVGVFRDVTERLRAEEALQRSEQFLKDVFGSIQDGISILDRDLNIVRVNPAMEKWYHFSMPLEGRKCWEAYHGRTLACEVCPSREALDTGKSAYQMVPKTGSRGEVVGWLDLYSFPLMDVRSGQLTGVIEYVRDISEQRRLEAESLAAKEQVIREMRGHGEYVREVADTLRNPLLVLRGHLSLLDASELNETQRARLEAIRRSSEQLLAGIEQLT